MFAQRFFPRRLFAGRYFPPAAVEVTPPDPDGGGGGGARSAPRSRARRSVLSLVVLPAAIDAAGGAATLTITARDAGLPADPAEHADELLELALLLA